MPQATVIMAFGQECDRCDLVPGAMPQATVNMAFGQEYDRCDLVPVAVPQATVIMAFGQKCDQTRSRPITEIRRMPQSLTKLYMHLIFSTKNRRPFLDDKIRERTHAYLATVVRDMECPYAVVGGVADHVHILFDMGKKHAPVAIIEHVKRESSKFVKTLGPQYQSFYWQRGYGMFSVSPTLLAEAEKYVRNQEEHHRHKTFQEEYRDFLQRYEIEYKEEYVWD